MRKTAVVLAGGRGTRLAPYTVVFPKPLMPLGETPVLEVVVRQLQREGFEDIVLAVGHLGSLIETYFGDGSQYGVRIRYAREDVPMGTAGPLRTISGLEAPFLAMNGDVLTTLDFGGLFDRHVASDAEMTVATHRRRQLVDFGVIETDASGRVSGYLEKPEHEYTVSMGVNVLNPSALDVIGDGEALDIPDLVLRLVGAHRHVRAEEFGGYWLDIGRHDDFAAAQEEFEKRRGELLPESSA